MIEISTGCAGEIPGRGKTALAAIADANVFFVVKMPGGAVCISDDVYCQVFLTKEQVLLLADELKALAS